MNDQLALKEIKQFLNRAGYVVTNWGYDDLNGRKRRYRVSGDNRPGPISYFDSREDLELYARQVDLNRAMESDMSYTEFHSYWMTHCRGRDLHRNVLA